MRGIQSERLIGQRFSSQPIGFQNGVRMLHESISQNGTGERVVFIQRVGFAQQIESLRQTSAVQTGPGSR